MPQAVAVVVIVVIVFLTMARLSATRRTLETVDEVSPTRRPSGRRQRKLEAYRAANPDPEIPTMLDLMRQEAEETGVNAVPGGEGIQVPVKLKVWRRDELVREACAAGVRFEIAPGVEPETATEDQVHLACLDTDRQPRQSDSTSDDKTGNSSDT